jgi:hypothetical protein
MIFSFLKRIFCKSPKPHKIVVQVVQDVEINRTNAFWKPYIGCVVEIVSISPDGLVDVKIHDQPTLVQGIDVARFTPPLHP